MRTADTRLIRFLLGLLGFGFVLVACGSDGETVESSNAEADSGSSLTMTTTVAETGTTTTTTRANDDDSIDELFPDVLSATASHDGDGVWTFSATLSSPYDSPQRYADAWRVLGPNGAVYGIRELAHDHAGEQPFTRRQSGIEIPDGIDVVTVEGRDQLSGWGGGTAEVQLQR